MKVINKISQPIMQILRKLHYKKMRKRLKNSEFSIISSDCFGAMVYHNLGQRFNSPTINLCFSQEDFYQFVLHLKDYLAAELVEIEDKTVTYPVGSLTYDDRTIRINFMHYHSFEEAKRKWDERKQRVDFSNIYIFQVVSQGLTQEYLDRFSALPYRHKLLIAHSNNYTCDCMVTHDIFQKRKKNWGIMLKYKSPLSSSRYMDDIDYVSFLNRT